MRLTGATTTVAGQDVSESFWFRCLCLPYPCRCMRSTHRPSPLDGACTTSWAYAWRHGPSFAAKRCTLGSKLRIHSPFCRKHAHIPRSSLRYPYERPLPAIACAHGRESALRSPSYALFLAWYRDRTWWLYARTYIHLGQGDEEPSMQRNQGPSRDPASAGSHSRPHQCMRT